MTNLSSQTGGLKRWVEASALPVLLAFTACVHQGGRTSQHLSPALEHDVLRAYERMQDPSVLGGEDVELLYRAFDDYLQQLGDERFARALASEPPERIAAVRHFFDTRKAPLYPKAAALLARVPQPEFPAVRATEREFSGEETPPSS